MRMNVHNSILKHDKLIQFSMRNYGYHIIVNMVTKIRKNIIIFFQMVPIILQVYKLKVIQTIVKI